MGRRAVDGYVAPMFRVGGTPLETNTAMIKLYITTDNGSGRKVRQLCFNTLLIMFEHVS